MKETLSEIRGKYWIIKGRSLIRAVIHKCVVCKCFEGKHFSSPPAPPLPSFRVTEAPPFTYTAVDFAGPVYIGREKGREIDKVWIYLFNFTCCITRAIHLDLVRDMSTPTFIRALKWFPPDKDYPRESFRIMSKRSRPLPNSSRPSLIARRSNITCATLELSGCSISRKHPGGVESLKEWSTLQSDASES